MLNVDGTCAGGRSAHSGDARSGEGMHTSTGKPYEYLAAVLLRSCSPRLVRAWRRCCAPGHDTMPRLRMPVVPLRGRSMQGKIAELHSTHGCKLQVAPTAAWGVVFHANSATRSPSIPLVLYCSVLCRAASSSAAWCWAPACCAGSSTPRRRGRWATGTCRGHLQGVTCRGPPAGGYLWGKAVGIWDAELS